MGTFARSIALLVFVLAAAVSPSFAQDDGGFRFRTDPEVKQVRPKKPVKIKLKRLGSGDYTWELKGDDPGEILRVDKELRKVLQGSEEK
ncbi:MAG: hypothetical protein P8Y39_02835 [Nitrospirota bacterium]|jgi:hypothetical protein